MELTPCRVFDSFRGAMINRCTYDEYVRCLGLIEDDEYQAHAFDLLGTHISEAWMQFFADYQFGDDGRAVWNNIMLNPNLTSQQYRAQFRLG